ncbi:hypothetical protein Taro_041010 [Colocasia esculenta]|uniref:Protein kinase domain-containing protein n=1 Tax=Colocasia esculenta TaxID=4460 RepID=A0A843WNJ2_COLES|nr:hypothetical protein [Colocasia esculenta]
MKVNLPPTTTHPARPIPPLPPSTCSNPGAPATIFRYEKLHGATDGFSPSNELDEGGHGSVYKGTLPDDRTIAIKRLYESSCRRAELFLNEVAILRSLHHPNLVALYGCTTRHSRELLIVYEFVLNGTIANHLHKQCAAEGALAWPLCLRIAVEIATALAHLHAVHPPILMAMDSQPPTTRWHCRPPSAGPFPTATLVPSALAHHRRVLCSSSWRRCRIWVPGASGGDRNI